MHYYKLIIAYDGTNYDGWHEQPHKKTVEDVLYTTFKTVFKREGYILAASRTDAGVHALGQVAVFRTDFDLEPGLLKKAWNDRLPPDIMIRSLRPVDASFHPHYGVKQKTYFYHVFLQRPLPFVARYGWHFPLTLDLCKLQECLNIFLGKHDFRSFCSSDYKKDTTRTIDSIRLVYLKRYRAYRIEVSGQRFAYNMIRRIVGAALYVARHDDIPASYLLDVLAEKNPQQILPTAPARGLLLYKIVYE
jgi:tRNA pseudouridine38-40 synthase